MGECYSADHIHKDITCNIEEPQQKYRLGTVSNRLLGGGGGLKHVLLDPNLALCFRYSWLVGCFGLTVFQSISGHLPKRGRKRRERIDESKNSKQLPHAPTASAVAPCPTVIQIVVRPGTGSLPSTIAPPDHPNIRYSSTQTNNYHEFNILI